MTEHDRLPARLPGVGAHADGDGQHARNADRAHGRGGAVAMYDADHTRDGERARRSTTSTPRSRSLDRSSAELSSGQEDPRTFRRSLRRQPRHRPEQPDRRAERVRTARSRTASPGHRPPRARWRTSAKSSSGCANCSCRRPTARYNEGDLHNIGARGRHSSPKPSSRPPTPSTRASTSSRARSRRRPPTKPERKTPSRATPKGSRARSARARRSKSAPSSPKCSAAAAARPTASCSTRCGRSPSTSPKPRRKPRPRSNTTDLKNLDGNIEALIQLQASTGSTTDQLKTAAMRIETLENALSKALSNTEDANIAQVVDRLLQRAGGLQRRAARRRQHRPGIAVELPALRRSEESHMSVTFESVRFGTVEIADEEVHRVPLRADRPRRAPATR